MSAFQLNWVVALRPEARAVIDRFSLKPFREGGLFPMYASRDGTMRLVISGPGKSHAAAATAALASAEDEFDAISRGWLNFGIAGSGELCVGEAFLAGKVTEEASGNVWYPVATWSKKHDLPRRSVTTVSRPTEDYPPDGVLIEMEAAGYYPIALRDSTVELCQVLKVVSDDPEHPIEKIDKAFATRLCEGALNKSESWIGSFLDLGREDSARLVDPPGYSEMISDIHFTVTQSHQLRRLLQQWHARRPDDVITAAALTRQRDARSILRELRSEVFSPGRSRSES